MAKKYNIEKELAKMEKAKIKEEVCEFYHAFNGGTIQDAIKCLQSYDDGEHYLEYECDYDAWKWIISTDRLETDKEFEKRKRQCELSMISDNNKIEKKENEERALYEKLAKKYGAKE